MSGDFNGQHYSDLLAGLLKSNLTANLIFKQFEVKALTDTTGFGLLGHLYEMILYSALNAQLNLDKILLLNEVIGLSEKGFENSFPYIANHRSYQHLVDKNQCKNDKHPIIPLLFDS